MRSFVLLTVLLGASALAAPATLETVRGQVADLQYGAAARALTQLGRGERFSKADALEFFTLEGMVKGALNDGAGARKAFTRALSIDPELKLPPGLAPRVSTPFLEAKAWVKEHGAHALAQPERRSVADGWELDFKPPPDDAGVIEKVVFSIVEDGASRELAVAVKGVGKVLVKGARVTVSWRLEGARAWVLHEGGPVTLEPAKVEAKAAPVPVTQPKVTESLPPASAVIGRLEKEQGTPRRFSPAPGIVLASVGTAAVLISIPFFISAEGLAQTARTADTPEELQYGLAIGRSNQTIAGIFLTAGSIVAAGGIALLVLSFGPAPSRVSFVPLPGGGAAVVQGVF